MPVNRSTVAASTFCEFLEGVTAGVVGLIAGTTIALMIVSIVNIATAVVFAAALAALFYFESKLIIPLVVIDYGAKAAAYVDAYMQKTNRIVSVVRGVHDGYDQLN